jgi:putative DNA primase/helicase
MNKQEILNKLDKAKFYQEFVPSLKVNGKPDALGLCPVHGDTHPSLSVNLETGLFRCFSCNFKGDIFTFYQRVKGVDFPTALKEIGKMAGVVESDTKQKVVATFKYTDEAGNLLYIKERLEPGRSGRSKEFVFKHLVNGKWTLGRGCDPALYNLPELIKSKYAFIVEGEAKADLLNSWGLTATCLDSGRENSGDLLKKINPWTAA